MDVLDVVVCLSLEDAGIEEYTTSGEYAFGLTDSNSCSIYSYTEWFYDGDESAFTFM